MKPNRALQKMPLILAHRGGRFWQSDNFSYITDAIREGADIIELDIFLSESGYIVRHSPVEKVQGFLRDALPRAEGKPLYLDIKDRSIDVPHLVGYVRDRSLSPIIIGSFDIAMLANLDGLEVTRCLHSLRARGAVKKGKQAKADWITPFPYFLTARHAEEIKAAGFKFVPAGNQIVKRRERMKNQLRYALHGAYSISTHHVKEMRSRLAHFLGEQEKTQADDEVIQDAVR